MARRLRAPLCGVAAQEHVTHSANRVPRLACSRDPPLLSIAKGGNSNSDPSSDTYHTGSSGHSAVGHQGLLRGKRQELPRVPCCPAAGRGIRVASVGASFPLHLNQGSRPDRRTVRCLKGVRCPALEAGSSGPTAVSTVLLSYWP